jgi:hypothetical protein
MHVDYREMASIAVPILSIARTGEWLRPHK